MASPSDAEGSLVADEIEPPNPGGDEHRYRHHLDGALGDEPTDAPTGSRVRHAKSEERRLEAWLIAATIGFGLAVWFLRRPDQLLHPYVWVEEFQILNSYQTQGLLHAMLSPVEGYMVWPTSFTVALAAKASFLHLPLLEYWASTAWYVATLCLILIPKSRIKLSWRIVLAVLIMLAPTNPEVYGIAEYTFWWTTLWPLISILWSKDSWWLRIPILVIGGMSSLAGAAIAVPYAVLYVMTRQRRYLVGTGVLGITLVVQLITYETSARSARIPIRPEHVALQELRNLSDYAFTWLKPTDTDFMAFTGALFLLAVVGMVCYVSLVERSPFTPEIVGIGIGLLVMSILSSIPAPLLSDPLVAGPRYYFLPYIGLGWLLFMIAMTTQLRWAQIAAVVLIVMSLLTLSQNFARHDDRVSWSGQLARCAHATKPFKAPVQFDGTRQDLWYNLVITVQTCHDLGYR